MTTMPFTRNGASSHQRISRAGTDHCLPDAPARRTRRRDRGGASRAAASAISSVAGDVGGQLPPCTGRAVVNASNTSTMRDDLREQRDGVAAQPVGIAGAVQPLVMVTNDRPHLAQRSQLAAQPVADHGVLLHDRVLGGRQPARLQQDRVGNADLADVVEIAAAREHRDIVVAQTDVPAERRWRSAPAARSALRCSRSRASMVSARLRITDSRAVEIVGVALDADAASARGRAARAR